MNEPQVGCDTGCGENRLFPAESAKQNTQQLRTIFQLLTKLKHSNLQWKVYLLGSRAESSNALIRVKIEVLSSEVFYKERKYIWWQWTFTRKKFLKYWSMTSALEIPKLFPLQIYLLVFSLRLNKRRQGQEKRLQNIRLLWNLFQFLIWDIRQRRTVILNAVIP